jgi:molybdopterin-guanine dinucleotide biosynthesis protein A
MGRDKAMLDFAGQPLIVRALSILRDADLTAAIAGGSAGLAAFAPIVPDAESGPESGPETSQGPLAGICSALAAMPVRYAVFVSVDMPFLPPSLPVFLLHHARITGRAITIPSLDGFAQTFPAVIDRAALPPLEAELAAGRNGCFAAFQAAAADLRQPISQVAVELIVQSGHVTHPQGLAPFRWFLNLNTPADLARAESLAPRTIA